MADQARRDGVEHLAQGEAARGGDGDQRLLIVPGAPVRQRPQRRPLGLDGFGAWGVLAADDLANEAAVNDQIVEVAPRISRASATAFFTWPCELSIEPLSLVTPRLLGVGSMP